MYMDKVLPNGAIDATLMVPADFKLEINWPMQVVKVALPEGKFS